LFEHLEVLRTHLSGKGNGEQITGSLLAELEARIRELEGESELYRAFLEELPEALLLSDAQGTIRWANRAAARLLGEGKQGLAGRCLREWLGRGPDSLAPGEVWSGWMEYRRGGETPRELLATVIALADDEGEVSRLGWVLRPGERLESPQQAGRPEDHWYYTLAEAARDAIFVIGKEGQVLYVNSAAARMIGCPAESILGRRPEELFGAFERQRRNLDQVFASGTPLFVEDAMEFQGQQRWLETSLAPLWGRDGRVEAVIGVSRDVSDRKRAEEALRRSEAQYRVTIDALADPIHMVDAEMRVVLCNQALRRRAEELGVGPEIIGRPLFELFPFLSDQVRQEYEQVFLTGQPLSTLEHTWIDGRLFVTETHKLPIVDSGRVIQVVTLVHDVTEHWHAEQALRASEERYRTLVETSPDAIVLTDLEGRIRMVNQRAAALYGAARREDLEGRDAFELFAPAERELLDEVAARVLEQGLVQGLEYTAMSQDGRPIPVQLSLSLVLDGQGRPTGFLAIAHDLTERKRLEAQFLQAQKMETLGRLAGGIAHDFNNLLTALQGYATLARCALPADSPAHSDLEQVLRIVEQGGRLTRQLLGFARRQTYTPQLFDLNEVVRDLERMLRRLIGEAIELSVVLDPRPCLVSADRAQVEQVVVNLVVNARDAMPQGGRVTVETLQVDFGSSLGSGGPGGPFVRLRVSDTGAGMSQEVLTRLFEPFFTTKASGQGTGLGLATVWDIVRKCQGQIEVSSEPGRGTTFDVYLPRVEGEKAPWVPPDRLIPIPRGEETVLLVEDDAMVRELLARVLRALGYTVLPAAAGEEALRLLREQAMRVDLLLSDFFMPGMDGETLAMEVRRRSPGVKVLYMSGYGEGRLLRTKLGVQEASWLCKPFGPAVLAQKVREVLDSPFSPEDGTRGEGDG